MHQKLSLGSIYSVLLPCLILKVALRYHSHCHFVRIKSEPKAHVLNHTLGRQEQGNKHRLSLSGLGIAYRSTGGDLSEGARIATQNPVAECCAL